MYQLHDNVIVSENTEHRQFLGTIIRINDDGTYLVKDMEEDVFTVKGYELTSDT